MQFLSLCRLQQLAMPSRLIAVLVSLLLATPAVIYWLWLVIVPLRVNKLCPEDCWCDVLGYHVDCSNKSLHNIPTIHLTHVQELFLNDNNITCLEKDSFISKGLTELDNLALDRCGLETIDLGAFNGLTELKYLSMLENGLVGIPRRTFENMNVLEYLGLQYNKIEHLDVNVFSGLINLRYINLEGNEIMKLHPDIFVGLHKLERLDLGANGGLQIPTDRHFITSHSLKVLNITSCNISSVSIETFSNVNALQTLDLSYNNLTIIDINILRSLPKLSALPLYDNPLQCDCQLKEVWRWCQDRNIRTDSYEGELECDSPSVEKRKWQWVLKELRCVQDNKSSQDEYKQEHNNRSDDENKQTLYKHSKDKNESGNSHVIINIVLTLLYTFLSIFGTIGNIVLLMIIICNKDMRTVPNMYILNLIISDLIFLTLQFAYITSITLGSGKMQSGFWCTFFIFCCQMSFGLSAYSVAVLSFRRYRVIVKPLHSRTSSQPKWRVTVSTICGVWIVASLFAIPSVLTNFTCSDHTIDFRNIAYHKHIFTFYLFVSCLLPVFVIAFFYIMAARHLVKSADIIFEETQNPQLNQRKNVAKYVMGLTVVFMISHVPYYAFSGYIFFSSGRETQLSKLTTSRTNFDFHLTFVILYCLFLINSFLNPVALFCTSSLFRKHLKCCCCEANSAPADNELRRIN